MSKRRRVGRDSRFTRDDSRPFAASGDTEAAQFEGVEEQMELTAGQQLRAMREAAGIDAALVASALKVAPQKIDALEGERYDELPDKTFARGLAAAYCRAFGADPAPVLARMPAAVPGLHATGNANQPMQGGSGMGSETSPAALPKPLLWIVALLLLLAAAIWFLPPRPASTLPDEEPAPLPAPAVVEPEHTMPLPPTLPASGAETAKGAASAASAAASASEAASAALAAAQPASAADTVASMPAKGAESVLALEATDTVWVEVVDATGRKRISRELAKGERVDVADAPLPLKVALGRREAVRVTVRGKPFDLAKVGGGTVARFQVE